MYTKHGAWLYKTLYHNKRTNFPPCRDNQTPSLSPSCLSLSNTFALSSAAQTTHELERWSGGRPAWYARSQPRARTPFSAKRVIN